MFARKSEKRLPIINQSSTISEHEQIAQTKQDDDDDQQHVRSAVNPGTGKSTLEKNNTRNK